MLCHHYNCMKISWWKRAVSKSLLSFYITFINLTQYHPDLIVQEFNHNMLKQHSSLPMWLGFFCSCTMVEVSVIFFYCVVHLSNKSCLSCRPCGKVMSSRPDSTPIILLCSSVTPTMRATCEAKQSEMHGHSLSLSLGLINHMDWFKNVIGLIVFACALSSKPKRILIRIFQINQSNIDRRAVVDTNQLCKQ